MNPVRGPGKEESQSEQKLCALYVHGNFGYILPLNIPNVLHAILVHGTKSRSQDKGVARAERPRRSHTGVCAAVSATCTACDTSARVPGTSRGGRRRPCATQQRPGVSDGETADTHRKVK